MMRRFFAFVACLSVLVFPWPLVACIALGSALTLPFLPLIMGFLTDAFYYAPYGGVFPLATVSGALVTILALFVRSRLLASIIRE